jgi:4-coumarate--CoA ligase
MICDSDAYDTVKEAMKELNNPASFYTTKGKVSDVNTIDELLKPTGEEDNYQITKFKDPSTKILALLPSSGTTDHLKGIASCQTMYLKVASMAPNYEIRTMSFSAIFWGPSFVSLVTCPLIKEMRIVTRKPFMPEFFMESVTKSKASNLVLNPTMLTMILNSPSLANFDTSHVKMLTAIGGIINEDLRVKMKKAFPKAYIMIFYGLTEISCAYTHPGQPMDDLTVGYVVPNHLMKIVDDYGKALNLGETGEILVKFSVSPFQVSIYEVSKISQQYFL